MRLLFLLFCIAISSCRKHSFDGDDRQIVAKNVLRETVKNRRSFDVISFKEDTLAHPTGTPFSQTFCYTIQFKFKDSTGTEVQKTGEVFFAPDGLSVIETRTR